MPLPGVIHHEADAWSVRGPSGVRGILAPPGDKSLAHRVLLLAALAEGNCRLRGVPAAEDVQRTLRALQLLGVRSQSEAGGIVVEGAGLHALAPPPAPIDCGNSGTTMRLLCGLLAAQPFGCELTGDNSLQRRPMQRVAAPLRAMGAQVDCLGAGGRPPLRLRGGPLRGCTHQLEVDSAQVRAAIWLAALHASGPTRVQPLGVARDHMERVLHALGVRLEADAHGSSLHPCVPPRALPRSDYDVPGELSAAAFCVGWALGSGSGPLRVERVGLNPGRAHYLVLLQRCGARVHSAQEGTALGEPWGHLEVEGKLERGLHLAGQDTARCIDEIPALLAACAVAGVEASVRDAAELRLKESDRIASLARLLRAFGAHVEAGDDGLTLRAGARLHAATVRSDGDHRLAMAAAVLAAGAPGTSQIEGVGCVSISYPDFRSDFARLAAV